MIPLGQRHQGALLVDAWQRGPWSFLRQGWFIALDRFLRKKHLVFRIDARAVLENGIQIPKELCFREVESWENLPDDLRSLLDDPSSHLDWGARDWFSRGWRLWLCIHEGKVAALGWWRNAAQSEDYFCKVPENAEVLWHAYVLPQYRGRNIQVYLRQSLMLFRIDLGIVEFFTNCREYNLPSFRNISKLGFKRLGCRIDSRITGKDRWYPTRDGLPR